jgi:hypothetical protein
MQDDVITSCCYDTIAGKDVKYVCILTAALLAPTLFGSRMQRNTLLLL